MQFTKIWLSHKNFTQQNNKDFIAYTPVLNAAVKIYYICINLLSKFFLMSVPFSGSKNNFANFFTFSQVPLSSWMHRWHYNSFNVLGNRIHGHSPATIITLFTERSAKILCCFFYFTQNLLSSISNCSLLSRAKKRSNLMFGQISYLFKFCV